MGDYEWAWVAPSAASALDAFEAVAATRGGTGRECGDRLGELLLGEGLVTAEELKAVLAEQHETGRRVGQIIIERGIAPAPILARLLAQQGRFELETESGFGAGLRGVIEQRHRARRAWELAADRRQTAMAPAAEDPSAERE